MNKQRNYQTVAAQFFVQAFGLVILAISAMTTFSFFSTYFVGIFPADMMGYQTASLLAGAAGVVLLDVACVYWLNTFLHHAETSEQRAISLILLVLTFIGAAAASVAQLGLSAAGEIALDPAARQSIADVSVYTVIAGVVLNFGANITYNRFSLESKQAVREANRRDRVQAAEDEQTDLLDQAVAKNIQELLSAQAAELAQSQAQRLVSQYMQRESIKYAGTGGADGANMPQRVIEDGRQAKEARPLSLNGHRNGYRPE